MTKVQKLMSEINKLDQKELELILKEIVRKINRRKQAESVLNQLAGSGEGVWDSDAQQYIDTLRERDRT